MKSEILFILVTVLLVSGIAVGCANKYAKPDAPRPYVIAKESGRWVWQIVSHNNELLAESEQDFANAPAALENYMDLRESVDNHPNPLIIKDKKL